MGLRNKILASFCAVMSLLTPYISDAALLLGEIDRNGHFRPFRATDPVFHEAYNEFMKHDWPSPVNYDFTEDNFRFFYDFTKVEGSSEGEITESIQESCRLKNLANCEGITVKWIPPTLWDLASIKGKYDSSFHNGLGEVKNFYFYGGETQKKEKMDRGTAYSFLQNIVYDVIISVLKKPLNREGLHQLDYLDYKEISDLILIEINKIEDPPFLRTQFEIDVEKAMRHEPTLFHKIIELEVQAHESDKVLLVRSTNGIPASAWPLLEKNQVNFKGDETNCKKPNFNEEISKLDAIDFPVIFFSEPPYKRLANLSYSNSLLAGYVNDGRGWKSACSYTYIRPNDVTLSCGYLEAKHLYALAVDKQKLSKIGAFFPGGVPSWAGTFGMYELFHPRVWSWVDKDLSDTELDDAISWNDLLTGDDIYFLEIDNQLIADQNDARVQDFKKVSRYLSDWLKWQKYAASVLNSRSGSNGSHSQS